MQTRSMALLRLADRLRTLEAKLEVHRCMRKIFLVLYLIHFGADKLGVGIAFCQFSKRPGSTTPQLQYAHSMQRQQPLHKIYFCAGLIGLRIIQSHLLLG